MTRKNGLESNYFAYNWQQKTMKEMFSGEKLNYPGMKRHNGRINEFSFTSLFTCEHFFLMVSIKKRNRQN